MQSGQASCTFNRARGWRNAAKRHQSPWEYQQVGNGEEEEQVGLTRMHERLDRPWVAPEEQHKAAPWGKIAGVAAHASAP